MMEVCFEGRIERCERLTKYGFSLTSVLHADSRRVLICDSLGLSWGLAVISAPSTMRPDRG